MCNCREARQNILNSYCVNPSLSVEPPSDGWTVVAYSVVGAVSVLYCCVEVAAGLVQSELLDAGVVVEVSSGLSVVVASWVVSMGDVVVGPPVGVVSDGLNEYHICLFLINKKMLSINLALLYA